MNMNMNRKSICNYSYYGVYTTYPLRTVEKRNFIVGRRRPCTSTGTNGSLFLICDLSELLPQIEQRGGYCLDSQGHIGRGALCRVSQATRAKFRPGLRRDDSECPGKTATVLSVRATYDSHTMAYMILVLRTRTLLILQHLFELDLYEDLYIKAINALMPPVATFPAAVIVLSLLYGLPVWRYRSSKSARVFSVEFDRETKIHNMDLSALSVRSTCTRTPYRYYRQGTPCACLFGRGWFLPLISQRHTRSGLRTRLQMGRWENGAFRAVQPGRVCTGTGPCPYYCQCTEYRYSYNRSGESALQRQRERQGAPQKPSFLSLSIGWSGSTPLHLINLPIW
jgi:hypothetical protein